ncbi:MAG TPA: hypothetical protein GX513_09825 [Firmicutes bacterium]|nr:hypothetical protein [Bacillota bacterium]
MARLSCLYMFVDSTADPTKHAAVIETADAIMRIVGVSNFEEGARVAREFADQGGSLIELCGGFGYAGAKRVFDEVGARVPVGMIVHQVWNAQKLTQLLGGEQHA